MAQSPGATVAAWLGRIPAADRLAADAYTHERLVAWLLGGLLIAAIALFAQRLGLLARLRDAVQHQGPRPWLAGAVCAGAFTLAVVLAKAPFDAVFGWRGDRLLHGAAAFAPRLKDAFASGMTLLLPVVVLAPLLQALMRRLPRTWWAWSGGAAAALILAFGWLPYALAPGQGGAPLEPGPMRDGLMRLVHDAGVPAHQIYLSPGGPLDTDVAGAFGRARVTVSRDFVRTSSPAEARAFVGHLAGHYAHGDLLSIQLVQAAVVVAGLLAIQLLFGPVARLMGGPRLTGPADPAAAPVVAVIVLLTVALGTPARGAFIQWVNVGADQFALDHSREADGLASFLIRDWDHMSVEPRPLERAVFYTHPPLADRMRHIAAWKAAHGA
ncbi:MAG: M48 family metalloprotease [Caulobacterales bacterium]